MQVNILTLFPDAFSSLKVGILGRSLGKNWNLNLIDMKDVKKIDHRPAGGGPGMLLTCNTIEHFKDFLGVNPIFVSPDGVPFNQKLAQKLSKQKEITILCGRYEGVDQRVLDYYNFQKISLGDFVLAGGEIAACAIIESVIRLLPGSMNNVLSHQEESFSCILLEHDQYTKPVRWNGMCIPPVLFSGHHKKQTIWKLNNSLHKTYKTRPDLYKKFIFFIVQVAILHILLKLI